MQIVIDVPDRYMKGMKVENGSLACEYILEAVYNGTPLPKGHGRLIDADEFEELFGKECVGDCGACMTKRKTDGRGRWYDTCSLIDISPTIIKADKAGDEG